jgi:protoporphyrinogen oxidase
VPTVCVIGAGLAGLTAARDLGRSGIRVIVLESDRDAGGLASSVVVAGRPMERFYHFICRGDADLIDLVDELGLSSRLHWRRTSTSYLHQGTLYPFGSPLDLLRFRPVPFLQRVRFGINVISGRYRRSWSTLDAVSARSWLTRQIGSEAYRVIWDPLLRMKFGPAHDQVSAAWIWHRIHRVATSRRFLWEPERFGYLEHGSATVIDGLLCQLRAMPSVEVRTGVGVQKVIVEGGRTTGVRLGDGAEVLACDAVLSTAALPVFLRLVPQLDPYYRQCLGAVAYLGVVCGLLRLNRPISASFWVNIHDDRTHHTGLIEYTSLNRHLDLGGGSIVYLPDYLEPTHERFGWEDERLLAGYERCLRCVNPAFDSSWIEDVVISRATYAQAICTVGFSASVPDHRSPVRGLYLTDSTQFYPEDRTLSAAVRLGRRAAHLVVEDLPEVAR